MILAQAKVAESRNPSGARLDWIGTVTFTGALFLLVFAIIRGNEEGWGSTLIIGLFTGRRRAARRIHRLSSSCRRTRCST